MIRAVVFDLDGVLLDSERSWDEARRSVAAEHGGRWHDGATAAMQGMSSTEWSAYLHRDLGVDLDPAEIVDNVVGRLLDGYRRELPLVPGAKETVERLGQRWPLALASSANRSIIDEVLSIASLSAAFGVTVSSDEVPRGKPAPDVYRRAAERLGTAPSECAAVEDSANGIRSAASAGMHVVAVPNRDFPPTAAALGQAELVVSRLIDLTPAAVGGLGDGPGATHDDRVDEEEVESFPASDPHADWAGPAD